MAEKEQTPPAGTPPEGEKKEEKNGENGEPKTPKTFTEEEHQAELNRIAAKTRDEEKIKREKDIEQARKAAREEALAEAKLSESEREKKQREKDALAEKERSDNTTRRENRLDALEALDTEGIDRNLVDFVVDLDKGIQEEKIKTLKTVWDKAMEKQRAEITKGNPPKDPNGDRKEAKSVSGFF
jgi:hypothetical protein